jgi:hypothetical protein
MELSSVIVVPICGHLPHDTEGKLLRMGHDATAKVVAAQSMLRSSRLRKQLYKEAMCIRLQEKKGWLAVRTDEFPCGDVEGAAKASLAIACYYLELDNLEKGHMWLQKAQDEAPKDKILLCAFIEHNMEMLTTVVAQCSATSTPVQSGRSSPVRPSTPENVQDDACSFANDLASDLASDLANITL